MKFTFSAFVFIGLFALSAFAGNKNVLVYSGRLVTPAGTPENSSSVIFTFQVLAPNGCVLWQETSASVNMSGSSGAFTVNIGGGANSAAGSLTWPQVFQNGIALGGGSLTGTGCAGTYTGAGSDDRTLYVSFNDGTGTQALGPMAVKAGAQNAMFAGYPVQLMGATPGNGQVLAFDATNNWWYPSAVTAGSVSSVTGAATAGNPIVIGGTASAPTVDITKSSTTTNGYLSSADFTTFNNKLSTVVGSSLTNGQIWVGNITNQAAAVTPSGDATISNSGVIALKATGTAGTYGSATQVPVLTTDAQGRVTGVVNTTITGAAPSGAAGGDLSGTYPNPSVASVGTSTAANVHTGEVLANAATNLNTASQIVKRDASGNFAAGTITASLTGAASLNVLKAGDTMTGPLVNNSTAATAAIAVTQSGAGPAATFMGGTVGIGSTTPATKLDVSGAIRMGMDATACSAANAGAQRYNSGTMEFCNSTAWTAYGISGGGVTSVTAGTGLTGGTITGTGTIGLGTELTGVNGLATTGFVKRTGAGAYSTATSISLTSDVGGVLPIANGGTALSTTPTDGQILIGKTATNNYQLATLTGTANQISITNGGGSITLATPQNIHTAATPTFAGLTLSGMSTAGIVKNNASGVLSGGNSVTLTTDVSGVLPVANGGTGASTFGANRMVMSGGTTTAPLTYDACTIGQVLQYNGTNWACVSTSTLTGTTDFQQGGNSFSATAVLGTKDANDISVITNNAAAMTIKSGGAVGIGSATPATKLDVSGAIRMGMDATACTAANAGAQRYNSGTMEFCNSTAWTAYGISGGGVTSVTAGTGLTGGTITGTGTIGLGTELTGVNGLSTTGVVKRTGAGAYTAAAVSLTADVSGVLPAVNGGTGQSGFTIGDMLYASSTTALSKLPAAASGYILTSNGAGAAPSWQVAPTSGINQLTGDVTAGPGSGSQAAAVALVGGSTAANVHTAEVLANAATNLNTASQIVKRDASGNFAAGTITASLTGAASLNVLKAGDTMTGALAVNVSNTSPSAALAVTQSGTGYGATIMGGNVGIGTTTPGKLLSVMGDVTFYRDPGSAGNNTLTLTASGGATQYAGTNINGFPIYHYTTGNTYLGGTIGTAASSYMAFDTSGNVGIGLIAPATKLDVSGAIRMGMDATACTAANAGAQRYNSGTMEFCNSTAWTAYGISGGGVTSVTAGTGLTGGTITGTGTIGLGTELAGVNGLATTGFVKRTGAGAYTTGAVSLTTDISGVLPIANGGTNSSTTLVGNKIMISSAGKIVENANVMSNSSPMRTDASGNPITGAIALGSTDVSGTLAATNGGTGQSSFTIGDILYASSTTAMSKLAASTSGYILTSNGVGAAPSWQAAPTSGITQLTGDVTAGPGSGSQAAAVALVGGSSAANVHAAEVLANAATNLNTASQIVRRDASGNFAAGSVTVTQLTASSSLRMGMDATACSAANAGAQRYNSGTMEFCNSTAWTAYGISGGGVTSVTAGTGLTGGTITGTGTIGLGTELAGVNGLATTGFVKRTGAGAYSTATSLSLTTDVSGVLPVANGGTGVASVGANRMIMGGATTTSPLTYDACTINQVLQFNGTSWACVNSSSLGGPSFTDDSTFSLKAGTGALGANWQSQYNVAIGDGSQANMLGNNPTGDNISIGHQAMMGAATAAYGYQNIAIGPQTLYSLTTGASNIAMGRHALYADTSGGYNIALGGQALQANTTGVYNYAIGDSALTANTTGYNNIAVGDGALGSNTTGFYNVATAESALGSNTSGDNNIASGYQALYKNTTGAGNVGMGNQALWYNTTGIGNVGVGYKAGVTTTTANGNQTGNYNTYIGYNAGPGTTSQLSNSMAIGANATVNASNAIVLGDGTVKVGIGSTTPATALDVVGAIRMGMDATACSAANAGAQRYNSGTMEYCNGTTWQAYGISGGGVTSVTAGTGLTGGTITGTGTIGLGAELTGLNGLATTGIVKRTGAGTYSAGTASLTADVSGVLPVANGGTNSSTALNGNRMMISSASAIVEAAAMTDGQVVVGKSGSAPQIVTMSGDATISNAGVVTVTKVNGTTFPGIGLAATNVLPVGGSAVTANQALVVNGAGTGVAGLSPGGATNFMRSNGTSWTSGGLVATDLPSGVVATGTYNSVTVDTYGRVTAGSNPTTVSGYGITDAVRNIASSVQSMQAGLDASKPAAGTAGRMYVASDTHKTYYDNGTSWVVVGTTAGTDITGNISGNAANVTGTVAVANGGTGVTAAGPSGNVLMSDGTNWVSSPAPAGAGALTWQTITTSMTMQPNYGYVVNAASDITMTLPTTCSVGNTMQVVQGSATNYATKVGIPSGSTLITSNGTLTSINQFYVSTQAGNTTFICTASNQWTVQGSTGFASSSFKSQVIQGYLYTCVIYGAGQAKCWGYNGNGQLGYGDTTNRCGSGSTGGTACVQNLPDINFGAGLTVVKMSSGQQHTCAILSDGGMKCWGYNGYGQLGYGDTTNRCHTGGTTCISVLPELNFGGLTVKDVATGELSTCAILSDNSLRCWGYNGYGGLGYGDTTLRCNTGGTTCTNTLGAVNLGAGMTALSVALDEYSTCAVLNDGTVKCWGYNGYGELGYGDTTNRCVSGGTTCVSSQAVINLGAGLTAKKVFKREDTTCVILNDNGVKCWGYNPYGQLGYGDTTTRCNTGGTTCVSVLPELNFGGGLTAKDISMAYLGTCALLSDGSLKCWGYNGYGELGTGDYVTRCSTGGTTCLATLPAVNFGAGRTVVAVGLQPGEQEQYGSLDTCVILDNNQLRCFGNNTYGETGDGYVGGPYICGTGGAACTVSLSPVLVSPNDSYSSSAVSLRGWYLCSCIYTTPVSGAYTGYGYTCTSVTMVTANSNTGGCYGAPTGGAYMCNNDHTGLACGSNTDANCGTGSGNWSCQGLP